MVVWVSKQIGCIAAHGWIIMETVVTDGNQIGGIAACSQPTTYFVITAHTRTGVMSSSDCYTRNLPRTWSPENDMPQDPSLVELITPTRTTMQEAGETLDAIPQRIQDTS